MRSAAASSGARRGGAAQSEGAVRLSAARVGERVCVCEVRGFKGLVRGVWGGSGGIEGGGGEWWIFIKFFGVCVSFK